MKRLCLFLVRTFRVSSLLRLTVFFLFLEDLYILKYVGGHMHVTEGPHGGQKMGLLLWSLCYT